MKASTKTPKRKTGRRPKFPEFSAQFLKHIASGQTIAGACALSGLGQTTVFHWLASARNAESGAFAQFRDDYTRARGQAQSAMVQEIRSAGQQDWRAVAWLAERMFGETFSLKLQHEVSGPDGGPIALTAVPTFQQVRVLAIDDREFDQAAGKPNYQRIDDNKLERIEGQLKIVLVRQSQSKGLQNI